MAFTLLMATGVDSIAQRGRGMPRMGGMQQVCVNIPGLTEEQSSQIMELRTAHLAEMQSYRDQIDINRAQYRSLLRSQDMSAIEANIDERTSIRNQMARKQAQQHQAIRGLLTEEQRVWFDAAPRGPGAGAGMGPGGRGAWGGRGALCPFLPEGSGVRGQNIMRNQPPFRRGF